MNVPDSLKYYTCTYKCIHKIYLCTYIWMHLSSTFCKISFWVTEPREAPEVVEMQQSGNESGREQGSFPQPCQSCSHCGEEARAVACALLSLLGFRSCRLLIAWSVVTLSWSQQVLELSCLTLSVPLHKAFSPRPRSWFKVKFHLFLTLPS